MAPEVRFVTTHSTDALATATEASALAADTTERPHGSAAQRSRLVAIVKIDEAVAAASNILLQFGHASVPFWQHFRNF
jgi:hypothetical protein